MKLLFKQRFFSWFDSYDIYNEDGIVLFTVKGKLAWGHCLQIFDDDNTLVGTVKEELLTLLPRFLLYMNEEYIGKIDRKFTFLKRVFTLDCNGWQVEGDFLGWDYQVVNGAGKVIAKASKQIFKLTDTYVIDVCQIEDSLIALMIVLAIDAAECSQNQ